MSSSTNTSQTHTILSHLCATPPSVSGRGVKSRGGFRRDWDLVEPDAIKEWNSFSFNSVRFAFWELLDDPLPGIPRDWTTEEGFEINHQDDLEIMVEKYCSETLEECLKPSVVILQHQLKISYPASVFLAQKSEVDGTKLPYVVFSIKNNKTPLVIGVFHVCKGWESKGKLGTSQQKGDGASAQHPALSAEKLESLKENRDIAPVRHLAMYAQKFGTPYGVIFTHEEVIVVRIFIKDQQNSIYGAQWQAVKWPVAGENQLTPNLAIWGLVMMSLNENYRKLVPENSLVELNTWDQVDDFDYENRFSLRKEPFFNLPANFDLHERT